MSKSLRLAVAQTTVHDDPREPALLRDSGQEIRRLMRDARDAGARIVHFTEGATCFPDKLVMSVDGPDRVGPSDWSRFRWDVLRDELTAIAALAGELGLWTVLGSVHRLTPPRRPHNSLYVISDRGAVTTRYDERTLSHTKITYMYTPGSEPITFTVDGFRFGCALGMDSHFPELFTTYEQLEVDCVLMSTTGGVPHSTAVATEVQGYAAANSYWVSLAVPSRHSLVSPAGLVAPDGSWVDRCPTDGGSALVVADLTPDDLSPLARTWRRATRNALPDREAVPDDTRSLHRTGF